MEGEKKESQIFCFQVGYVCLNRGRPVECLVCLDSESIRTWHENSDARVKLLCVRVCVCRNVFNVCIFFPWPTIPKPRAGDESTVGVPAVPNSCHPVQSVVQRANSWELEMTPASQLLQGRRGRGGVWLCMWAMWLSRTWGRACV